MLKDFKKFVVRGNVVDLAVAVIIGGAFGKIVSSFVGDIVMPLIGKLIGKVDFKTLKWVLEEAVGDQPEVAVYYGNFIQNVVDFLIVALVIFIVIQIIEKIKRKPEAVTAAPAKPTEEVVLLTEIRDLLRSKN
ncbi:large-conductance mechanosensitive channel protein MscL [Fusibacter bizertensis]